MKMDLLTSWVKLTRTVKYLDLPMNWVREMGLRLLMVIGMVKLMQMVILMRMGLKTEK